jgi:hypothetical protein
LSQGFATGAVLLTVAGWFGGIYLIALLSGWLRLAQRYRCEQGFGGDWWRFQSCAMRWGTAYRGILTLGANAEGLYLEVPYVFRVGHPPLFVPWSEITVSERRRWMVAGTQFMLGRNEQIPLWVYAGLGAKVLTHREGAAAQDVYSRPGLEPPRSVV